MSPRYVMLGWSMAPTLKERDTVEICRKKRYRRGDVILFDVPGSGTTVAHRVIACSTAGLRTRGDRTLRHDPWLIEDRSVRGKVTLAVRRRRRIHVCGGVTGAAYGAILWSAFRFRHGVACVLGSRITRLIKNSAAVIGNIRKDERTR